MIALWIVLFVLFWVIPWIYICIFPCTCGDGLNFRQKFFPKAESFEFYSIYCCPLSAIFRSWCCYKKPDEKAEAENLRRKKYENSPNMNPHASFYGIKQIYVPPEGSNGLEMKQTKTRENLGDTKPDGLTGTNIDVNVPHPRVMHVAGSENSGNKYVNPKGSKAQVAPIPESYGQGYGPLGDTSTLNDEYESPRIVGTMADGQKTPVQNAPDPEDPQKPPQNEALKTESWSNRDFNLGE